MKDELWSDIERDIAEFKKKVEFGKADGYFWNMYFNLRAAIDLCLQE